MPNQASFLGRMRLPYLPVGVAWGFIIAFAAVIVIAAVSWLTLERTAQARARVTRAAELSAQLQSLLSVMQDAESGQRGFLLTGEESYLAPYNDARAALPGTLGAVRGLAASDSVQTQRLETLAQLAAQKFEELQHTIELRRAGKTAEALSVVRSDQGKLAMDRIREEHHRMLASEAAALTAAQIERAQAGERSLQVVLIGSATLLVLIAISLLMTSRNFRRSEAEVWVRSGQGGLSDRMQGDQRVDVLGDRVLSFLCEYLDAPVGALYLPEAGGVVRFAAGYAVDLAGAAETVAPHDGLLGQALKERRLLHVTDVPAGHLPVTSSLGRSSPSELLLMPAVVDGRVEAVVELGFLRPTRPTERELLMRASESLAVAVRGARDRTRLEDLLEETQRQSEELQTQQEELRVSNEELEEQRRALQQSNRRLESQQAELEETNARLEEQAEEMRVQSETLARSETELRQKAGDLERASQYKSEFLANMSHELRTPLNSSLILSQILADNKTGNLTAEQVKFAQTISSAGNDLLALINDILDLSKVEAGRMDVVAEPVRLRPFVDQLAHAFEPMARERGLRWRVQVDPAVPQTLETDSQRVGQILKNLLSNAVKFTSAGEVRLQVTADGEHVRFTVHDTGIGIAADQQEAIFEAFRQADGGTQRRYGGTGLGLTIARDLARLLGGDIAVASTPGQGSVFTLMLPRQRVVAPGSVSTAAAATTVAAPAPVPADLPPPARRAPAVPPIEDDRDRLTAKSRIVLVVEDDARFAALLRDLARELGFACVIAQTANDGLAAAELYRPHAIVLDINLPDHSGLGVLDQLKRNPRTRHVPVHIASVSDFMQEAFGMGAIGYALKPVKREQLIEAFRRLEAKLTQSVRRVLVVEDDARQRESMTQLLGGPDVVIVGVETAAEALVQLRSTTFDCVVMDLNLPDASGYELLESMSEHGAASFPPVIVYTGRSLSGDDEQRLRRYSRSIIIKGARSPERLLDEVTLFLHQVEESLPPERQRMLRAARSREAALDGRCVLVVEDDVRNVFALSSVLETHGAKVVIARNGREAIDRLEAGDKGKGAGVDLVLMDIMMPEMDGYTAMREIRRRPEWQKLPIIALTAKAMRDDQEKCLDAGANDYIAKPLDVEKLLSLVRVWMPR